VVAGELSAHRAAVKAGIRTHLVQVAPTVEGFARAEGVPVGRYRKRLSLGVFAALFITLTFTDRET
jgi:hypothetical protein